jgi:hypothetical protein
MAILYVKVDFQYTYSHTVPDVFAHTIQQINGVDYAVRPNFGGSSFTPDGLLAHADIGSPSNTLWRNPLVFGSHGTGSTVPNPGVEYATALVVDYTTDASRAISYSNIPFESITIFQSNSSGGIDLISYQAKDYEWLAITLPDGPSISITNAAAVTEPANGSVGIPASATFTVTLDRTLGYDVNFSYATASGTAISGADFAPASGTGTITAGATQATISVPILADAQTEPSEGFVITISNPSAAGGVTPNIATATGAGTILDRPFGLFTNGADVVDFNQLTADQRAAITAGAEKYDAGAGDDRVALPSASNAHALSFSLAGAFDGGAGIDVVQAQGRRSAFEISQIKSDTGDEYILAGRAERITLRDIESVRFSTSEDIALWKSHYSGNSLKMGIDSSIRAYRDSDIDRVEQGSLLSRTSFNPISSSELDQFDDHAFVVSNAMALDSTPTPDAYRDDDIAVVFAGGIADGRENSDPTVTERMRLSTGTMTSMDGSGAKLKTLVVAFEGTNTEDLASYLNLLTAAGIGSFQDHYDAVHPIITQIQEFLRKAPDVEQVLLTGHSLGGALTQYAAPDLAVGVPTYAITFGSPGGNSNLSPGATKSLNIVHTEDPVGMLSGTFGLERAGTTIYVERGGSSILPDFTEHSKINYEDTVQSFERADLDVWNLATKSDLVFAFGSFRNDTIKSSDWDLIDRPHAVYGFSGKDHFLTNDTRGNYIDLGAGNQDSARYIGARDEYTVTKLANGDVSISSKSTHLVDILHDVERLGFGNAAEIDLGKRFDWDIL